MKWLIRISLTVYALLGALAALVWLVDWAPFLKVRAAITGAHPEELILAQPWALLAVVPLVPLAVLALTRRRRKAVGTMAFSRGDLLALAPVTWRQRLEPLLPLLRALGVLLLILALARPQAPSAELVAAEGIDIAIALDMSGSMVAIDLTPNELRQLEVAGEEPQDRFAIAAEVLSQFVERRRENPWFDRIALVLFAKEAFLQFPRTIDYDTVLWLISRLEVNAIDPSQTAIGNALFRSVMALANPDEVERLMEQQQRSSGEDAEDGEVASRIIILITDGDERGGNVSALEMARVAADLGITVYPVLVGREGPVLVPVDSSVGFGQRYVQREYPVDPDLLREIAETTGGAFFEADDRRSLETSLEAIIAEYDRTSHEESLQHRRVDLYFGFVLAAFILLGLELLLRYGPLRKFP